jgi:outer membrane protein TolC
MAVARPAIRLDRIAMIAAAAAGVAAFAPRATAQQRGASPRDTAALSLEQAISRAVGQSQEVRLARSQVDLAETQVTNAKSGAYPQLNAQVGFTRTFASSFNTGATFTLPDSLRFQPDSTRSLAERVKYLEENVPNAGLGGLGSLFGSIPLGRPNAYNATMTGSQVLYSGGKVGAGLRIANQFLEQSRFNLQEQTADIELQVRTAYFQARLAQELVGISQAAVEQASKFLASERVRLESGLGSELDVLRSEVSLANLQPQLIQATNAADVATLNLKRLVDLPLGQPIQLTTPLDARAALATPRDSSVSPEVLSRRAAIAAEERQVRIREEQVKIARGGYLPSVNLSVSLGRQLFPNSLGGFSEDWRSDVTAGVVVTVPIFNGFRTKAEIAQAQVALDQERLRLSQLRESVQVEYERARGERDRARASIQARQRTVDQAQRVHDLTVLRYEQGLASQLEVSDARLSLLQARTNLAQAVSDFQIASATLSRAVGATTYPQP